MRYRNVKTGAVIDVPSKISGKNWERLDGGKVEKPAPVVLDAPVVEEVPEVVEEVKPVKKTRKTAKKTTK